MEMTNTSSVPPPYDRTSPFPVKTFSDQDGQGDRCYISGERIGPNDKVVLIQNKEKNRHRARITALYEVLGLETDEERRAFDAAFVANNMDRPPELLWFKLMRHNRAYFNLLLAALEAI